MNVNTTRRINMKPRPQKLVLIYCRRRRSHQFLLNTSELQSGERFFRKKKRLARLDLVIFVSADLLEQ